MADDEAPARGGAAGRMALVCAVIGLGGFSLTPWLAYLPAVLAIAQFTLVIWFGVYDAFARTPVPARVAVTLLAGSVSTAVFWVGASPWYTTPALWSALATFATRAVAWAATACLAIAYGAWLMV